MTRMRPRIGQGAPSDPTPPAAMPMGMRAWAGVAGIGRTTARAVGESATVIARSRTEPRPASRRQRERHHYPVRILRPRHFE